MELYKNYPRLCTIWCFIEILFYAGQLFGWSSLLYVLKQEGFYLELCSDTPVENNRAADNSGTGQTRIADELYTNDSLVATYLSDYDVTDVNVTYYAQSKHGNYTHQNSLYTVYSESNEEDKSWREFRSDADEIPRCTEQDARLNLWFSIAICVAYVICSIMGPILQRIGMRNFRLLSMLTYITGALCLGFATPEIPWLICPGLCCIGVAGMALYSTNIHVSFLFPAVQSTITAVFVGLYDASTVVTYLMKVAFDGGISRKYYYTGLAVIHLALIGTSTLLFLPCVRIKPRVTNTRTGKSEYVQTEKEKFIKLEEKDKGPSVCRILISSEYLLHVYWMCVQGFRFVSFLGFFNTWMENKFNGNAAKENYYLGVFSYVTMATVITSITAGMLHDCQRRSYMLTDDFKRRRMPIILPLTVTSIMSIVITSLIYVETEAFLNLVFVLFTIYRSYLFSYEITFLNDVYPLKSFSVLFGILHSSAGLSGLIQYPVFEWYKSYDLAPNHVNILLIVLAATSLAHPFSLWYRCRKHKCDKDSKFLGTEIYI